MKHKLKALERDFCELFGIKEVEHSIINPYIVKTKYGLISVFFDYDSECDSIFCIFKDTSLLVDSCLYVNKHTGKMNFIGVEANESFINIMNSIKDEKIK